MQHKILVTGGTGYVGSWVVKGLLEEGHTVRLTVRNKSKKENYQFLDEIANKSKGDLEIWEADLLKEGSYNEAVEGCDTIIHMASPFSLSLKNAQINLIDPAVKGTSNVLSAANKSTTVKKVILTSSAAAVYGDAIDMSNNNLSSLTEADFNTTSSVNHQPYSYSKVKAEKTAWEMSKNQSNWQLIVMNPSFVMGPYLNPSSQSPSVDFIKDMLSGKFKMGVPELYMGYVDVRNVAEAHIYGIDHDVEGRHILTERVMTMLSFAKIVKEKYGDIYKLPTSYSPKWLLKIIGSLFGLTRKFISNNVGYPIKLDATKSKEKLNIDYIPMEQSIEDMVEQYELFKK